MEKYLLSFINSFRSENSLNGLYPHYDVGNEAKKHSKYIREKCCADKSNVFPEKDEIVINYIFESDNTWKELQQMFEKMKAHEHQKGIILSSQYTHVGIGVEMDTHEVWLTLRFLKI